jgi:hypothetical protein
MRASEAFSFLDIAATTAPFNIRCGGLYSAVCSATGTGSVILEQLSGDGVTYCPVPTITGSASGFTATTGVLQYYLPRGTFKFVVSTFTAIYIAMQRVPIE